MKAVLTFIWDFRFFIILALLIVFKAVTDWQGFKADLYKYMLVAKKQAKDGILTSGQQQEEWVVKFALQNLPPTWEKFIGEDRVRKWVQALYRKGIDLIDDGKINDSYPPGNNPPTATV